MLGVKSKIQNNKYSMFPFTAILAVSGVWSGSIYPFVLFEAFLFHMLVLLSIRKSVYRSRKSHRCLVQGTEPCRSERICVRIRNIVPDT